MRTYERGFGNMKKFLICAVAIAAMVILSLFFITAAHAETMYVSGNNVRERTEPNTNSTIVTTHNKGKDVEVVAIQGKWAMLDNGNFMHTDYLVPESEAADLFYNLPMYLTAASVRERTSPDTSSKSNIAHTYQGGEIVRVAAKLDNGWYLLMNGNYIRGGFLSADFMDVVRHFAEEYDDIVIVSISQQKVAYFKNGQAIVTGNCVTGHSTKSPTPTGFYTVNRKNHDFDMNGNPKNHVKYAAYFNGGIALHDADHWRSSYGGSIYIKHGSHGCVNLPESVAKVIYENCRVNRTRVLVVE